MRMYNSIGYRGFISDLTCTQFVWAYHAMTRPADAEQPQASWYLHVMSQPWCAQAGWAAGGGEGRLQLQAVTAQDVEAARHSNRQWLEDCTIRLLCVLALDRFGDFTSDQVTPTYLCRACAHAPRHASSILYLTAQTMPVLLLTSTVGFLSFHCLCSIIVQLLCHCKQHALMRRQCQAVRTSGAVDSMP